ncbi:unnamed protein product, partial [Vitis vinifera]|uniref:Uncharacterized protein n=1 Tax=Vitis vinifera TaxID=29760 RepID=D7T3Z7_VITVI
MEFDGGPLLLSFHFSLLELLETAVGPAKKKTKGVELCPLSNQ